MYEIIPRKWHARLLNRADFVGMAIFDLWVMSRERRHAIFASVTDGLRAVFVDHSHTFGGPSQESLVSATEVLYYDREIYAGCWTREITDCWLARIRSLTIHEVHAHIDRLPSSWVSESWRYAVTALIESSRQDLEQRISRLVCFLTPKTSGKCHSPDDDATPSLGL